MIKVTGQDYFRCQKHQPYRAKSAQYLEIGFCPHSGVTVVTNIKVRVSFSITMCDSTAYL
jgi:hypothetical protein